MYAHNKLISNFSPKLQLLVSEIVLVQVDPRRDIFLSRVEKLIKKLPNFAPVDAAIDQKAKEFFHDCLPPVLTPGLCCNIWDYAWMDSLRFQ